MKKGTMSTILLILVLVIGLSLLLYPSFSDWWNSKVQSYAVADYVENVSSLDDKQYAEVMDSAVAFNQSLLGRENVYTLTEEQQAAYGQQLNLSGNGIMAYVEIPKIDVLLPIYHGTEESVLSVAIGHLDWTSLPTGGASTHCVISGHRGLPSAKLFTDIDQLVVGDTFVLWVLDTKLTYEVDQILIVEPHETESLLIEEGKDLCTLVTCTPYGINSHRLLVRGHRVENEEEAVVVRVTSDAVQIEPMLVACVLSVPFLVILLTGLLIFDSLKRKRKN